MESRIAALPPGVRPENFGDFQLIRDFARRVRHFHTREQGRVSIQPPQNRARPQVEPPGA